ncbi:hypothetical protein BDR26DRAFT_366596 [Obelidium mucronatum]|nr:hypothetical protein BDR26DRAFT_366596 [Obelidium mucronatum]
MAECSLHCNQRPPRVGAERRRVARWRESVAEESVAEEWWLNTARCATGLDESRASCALSAAAPASACVVADWSAFCVLPGKTAQTSNLTLTSSLLDPPHTATIREMASSAAACANTNRCAETSNATVDERPRRCMLCQSVSFFSIPINVVRNSFITLTKKHQMIPETKIAYKTENVYSEADEKAANLHNLNLRTKTRHVGIPAWMESRPRNLDRKGQDPSLIANAQSRSLMPWRRVRALLEMKLKSLGQDHSSTTAQDALKLQNLIVSPKP